MKMLDLIEQYRKRLEDNPNDYTCLLFVLQIPNICARIECPKPSDKCKDEKYERLYKENCKGGKLYKANGKPWDGNLYKTWLKIHSNFFIDIYQPYMELDAFCKAVYDLRCQVTHEGVLMPNKSHFYFTNSDNAMCLGDVVFLPMKRLCERMLDAAMCATMFDGEMVGLSNELDITPFKDMFVPDDVYHKIRSNTEEAYKSFWQNYSEDDHMLNCICGYITLTDPDMKSKIDAFFKNQPNDTFEIWDFGFKFTPTFDAKQRFIKQKYDESKSILSRDLDMESDVLCLTKLEYERMLQVHKEFEEFKESNPFDMTQYSERS